MSLAISQCVYSQIQRYSLSRQKPRSFGEQVAIFAVTRLFDVGLTTAAAVAAAAAGTNAMGVPLTSDILRHAAVGGALKATAMAVAGLIMLAPQNAPLIVLMTLLGTSIGSNIVLVAAVANRVLGSTPPNELIIAAVVASIPLSFCFIYYYGAFRVPITFTSIAFDVLGAYTFVRMADKLGYPICPNRPALVAGAVFGIVFSFTVTLLGCCVIGKSRSIHVSDFLGNGHVSGTAYTTCCGNRVHISVHSTEYATGYGVSGSSNTFTNGTVYNSAHGIGLFWDPGSVNGGLTFNTHSTRDCTTSNTTSNMNRIVMV